MTRLKLPWVAYGPVANFADGSAADRQHITVKFRHIYAKGTIDAKNSSVLGGCYKQSGKAKEEAVSLGGLHS